MTHTHPSPEGQAPSEMVLRVARAMAALRKDAEGGGAIMDLYGDLARAAILAMREPTGEVLLAAGVGPDTWEDMIDAGADVLLCEFGGSASNHFWSASDLARSVYQAMIGAAGDRE